jgi:hypothetical protein
MLQSDQNLAIFMIFYSRDVRINQCRYVLVVYPLPLLHSQDPIAGAPLKERLLKCIFFPPSFLVVSVSCCVHLALARSRADVPMPLKLTIAEQDLIMQEVVPKVCAGYILGARETVTVNLDRG